MKPLQWIALGYVLIALYARNHGYDLLADPIGWLLILVGVRRLPATYPRSVLLYVGAVAAVVATVLWVPAATHGLDNADPSLAWASDLPALGFGVVLCHALRVEARTAGDRIATLVLGGMVTASLIVAVLPVLVFGGGLTSWGSPADAAGQLLHLAFVVVMLTYATRSWAGAEAPEEVESAH